MLARPFDGDKWPRAERRQEKTRERRLEGCFTEGRSRWPRLKYENNTTRNFEQKGAEGREDEARKSAPQSLRVACDFVKEKRNTNLH